GCLSARSLRQATEETTMSELKAYHAHCGGIIVWDRTVRRCDHCQQPITAYSQVFQLYRPDRASLALAHRAGRAVSQHGPEAS
ncbi:MAG: hypothetical protein NUW01_19715, partial [Gemmatimonadaceae bacterium]|nr:hypothetical protein [Gemmatimonadaceae bacterium]